MSHIAIAEIISAVYVFLSLISLFVGRDRSVSMKRLKVLYVTTLVFLLSDAISYIFEGPGGNHILLYVVTLLSYTMTNVVLAGFMYYCDAYIREKTKLKPWIFHIPMGILLINAAVEFIWFVLGKLGKFENGFFEEANPVPEFVLISDTVLLFYAPIVAFIKRKNVGIKSVLLLVSYVIPTVLSAAVLAFYGYDLTVIACAVSIVFIASLLQKEVSQAQMEKVAAYRAEKRQRDEIIDRMLSDEVVFLIDCVKDTRKTIHDRLSVIHNYNDDESYSKSLDRYIDRFVVESDREVMRKFASPAYMLEHVKTENEFSVEYRDITTGMQRFFRMRVVKFSDTEVMQSFSENDREIVDRLMSGKLKDAYFAIFIVDLDAGLLQVMKDSARQILGQVGNVLPYAAAMEKLSLTSDDEAKKFIGKIRDVNYIKNRFTNDDKATFVYRSHFGDGTKWGSVTEIVLARHDDGTPSLFALGFSLLDENAVEKEKLQINLRENMQVIGGLASEYFALYFVNIDEHSFKVYSINEKLIPEIKPLVSSGGDGFSILRKFCMSSVVHPDDRHLFMDISEESIRERLSHVKKFSIRYRRNFGGKYLWASMDVLKYEAADERANAIAVGFAERDAEIRGEQSIVRCLAVLGKNMSPDNAIADLLTAAGEFYGADRAYIFEFDRANEEFNNTYEWCRNSVSSVISGLKKIPLRNLEGWMNEFKVNGIIVLKSLDSVYAVGNGLAIAEKQGVKSIIAVPIMSGDEIAGFVGVDNPSKANSNLEVLKTVACVAYSEVLKRKETEIAKYESAKFFADIFLKSYISAYYVNLSDCSQIVFTRSRFIEEHYGRIENYLQSVNSYIDECVHPEDRGKMHEAVQPDYIRRRLKNENGFSINMRDISGKETRWYCFDVTRGADDDHAGFAFSDVTGQIQEDLERQHRLEDALSMSQAANRAKTAFLNSMSHDIRTPMNAIVGFTGLAESHMDNKELVRDYLGKIEQSSSHLLSLINEVLDMSRIESGKMNLNEKEENLAEIIDSLRDIVQADIKAKHHEFTVNMDDVHEEEIVCDRLRLNQVLLNILSNSIKYTPPGGIISVSIAETEVKSTGYATFEFRIKDNGIGMSKEFLNTIFEPFTRAKSTTVSGVQGTGLGMAITKNIIDMAGGMIEIHSEPGKGTETVVSFDFKLCKPHDESFSGKETDTDDSNKHESLPDLDFTGKKVLLVEDNALNSEIAQAILEEYGFTVDVAEDGDIAVEKVTSAESGRYDLVLMDIQMPRMNGYEATRAIRAWEEKSQRDKGKSGVPVSSECLDTRVRGPHHMPIVAMTANAFAEDRKTALEAGMDEHISKPVDINRLKEILSRFV